MHVHERCLACSYEVDHRSVRDPHGRRSELRNAKCSVRRVACSRAASSVFDQTIWPSACTAYRLTSWLTRVLTVQLNRPHGSVLTRRPLQRPRFHSHSIPSSSLESLNSPAIPVSAARIRFTAGSPRSATQCSSTSRLAWILHLRTD